MLTPETLLQGRYRIIRQLGQGGMGAVYEAVDERLDTTVALKETLFTDERLRKQFEREARLLARMHHPALPRVSDHFSENEGQFLVMQFIAGEDLGEMMKEKQGPFPAEQVMLWGDQLLDALDYLHTQEPQIVHRDIKPQNLKLTSRGQIILLDFGLAKGQTAGVSVVTTASIFGYTPNYAPLEQIQGLGTDPRSDIYALSATLYHLMTGVKPPDALTRAAALVNGENDPLQPANEVNTTVNQRVASVLARGMSQGREQRFASASAMRAAMKGEDATLATGDRTEAATVIFPAAPTAPTVVAPPHAVPTAALRGETTVVQTVPRKSGLPPWAIMAAAIVLIGVAVGVFYAIQKNNGATVVATPTPQPSPSATSAPAEVAVGADTDPVTGGTTDQEAIVKSAEAAVKKSEKVVKDKANPADRVVVGEKPKPSAPLIGNPTWNAPQFPETPAVDSPDNSMFRRRGSGVRIRNLPDGSRIVINPDGTRVMILADGTRRVLPPAPRPRRQP
jgi:serine/threonine protein kinase